MNERTLPTTDAAWSVAGVDGRGWTRVVRKSAQHTDSEEIACVAEVARVADARLIGRAPQLAGALARIERCLDDGLRDGSLSPTAPAIVGIGRALRRALGVRTGSETEWLP
jgi:hypothetical protein